jgi:hypothetical protein
MLSHTLPRLQQPGVLCGDLNSRIWRADRQFTATWLAVLIGCLAGSPAGGATPSSVMASMYLQAVQKNTALQDNVCQN